MTAPAAITATGLRKSYGDHHVLNGIDLTVPTGSVFALLGPNGSGKSTTVNILSTLQPADAGRLSVAGHDVAAEPDAVRAAIGVTGQFSAVDGLLTGRENLQLMADLQHLNRTPGRRRVEQLLAQFDLTDAAGKPAATYSGGMRRRLDLAMTLVGDPQIIFLDEPTTGLDPRSRRTMWDIVRSLVVGGVTILLTTQYLDEADSLADVIAVLDAGHVVAAGSPAELKRRIPGGYLQLQFPDPDALAAAAQLLETSTPDDAKLTLRVPTAGGVVALRGLLDKLHVDGIAITDLSIHTPDLDDVFFAVTGHRAAEATTTDTFDPQAFR